MGGVPSSSSTGGDAVGSTSTSSTGAGGSMGPQTVYDVISADPNYASLKAAVDKAGLAPTLQDPTASITLFAPDNNAFANLFTLLQVNGLGAVSVGQLDPVLRYHVLDEEADAAKVTVTANNASSLTSLGGSIEFGQNGSTIQLDDGIANLVSADITASNGIVHGISGVLLPSAFEVFDNDPNFSSLIAALGIADSDPQNPQLAAALKDGGPQVTVFAPTNQAFADLVTTLAANPSTGITGLTDFGSYQLVPILRYHVAVAFSLTAAGFGVNFPTLGGGVKTAKAGNTFTADGINVSVTDLRVRNGRIHVVDGVLLPAVGEIVATSSEFSALSAAVSAADNAPGTSPNLGPALNTPAGSGAYTLFAPTNGAFAQLASPPTGQALTNVLAYHVLDRPAPVYAADALALPAPTVFDTLLGSTPTAQLVVSSGPSGVLIDDSATAQSASVEATNYFASNGVIHRIDKVLLPQ